MIKIVILGNLGVGKTSLRRAFLGESFESNYIATVGSDFSYVELKINKEMIGLALWDLAGQKTYRDMNHIFYSGANGYVIVYSIIDKQSFLDLKDWISDFIEHTPSEYLLPLLILSNKIDLQESDQVSVNEEEFNQLGKDLELHYRKLFPIIRIPTSAKTGENVIEAFTEFTSVIVEQMQRFHSEGQKKEWIDVVQQGYVFAMNQIVGPLFITFEPLINPGSDGLMSMLSLISSLQFGEIIKNTAMTGIERWGSDHSICYIAFVIENYDARDKNELYFIGLCFGNQFIYKINEIAGLIDGYLHNAMNEFLKIKEMQDFDFVTIKITDDDEIESRQELGLMLRNLISELNELFKQII